MRDMVGEAVDRLITIEAKNHGMPHGICSPCTTRPARPRATAGDHGGGAGPE